VLQLRPLRWRKRWLDLHSSNLARARHGAAPRPAAASSEHRTKSLRVPTPLFGICCVGWNGGCQAERLERCLAAHRRPGGKTWGFFEAMGLNDEEQKHPFAVAVHFPLPT